MRPLTTMLALLGSYLGFSGCAPDPESLHQRALQDWQDMRFGMFIHWGPVSLKGTEIGWSRGRQGPIEEYDKLYQQFNPVKFDAEEWARSAKDAGMKYIVLTSKHHDGFCLWDTKETDYNIMNTPFGRDVIKELAAACKKEGIAFGTYYSTCDWYHPDYPLGSPGGKTEKANPDMERYVTFMHNQLSELIQNYGPLVTMWFDGEWESPWTHELGEELYHFVREQEPGILINNRVDKGRKGMEGTTSDRAAFYGDYDTPEQRVGTYQPEWPWESCITICKQWAWKPEDNMKSLEQCIHTLVNTVGGGGNLLLNVGPMPDGRIEPRQVARLREIGLWLEKNGNSIYGTRAGPFTPGDWGASTQKGSTIYLHVLNWPDGKLSLPGLEGVIESVKLMNGNSVSFAQSEYSLVLTKPSDSDIDPLDTILELKLK